MIWPEDIPKGYRNACQDPCDMWEGPCICGAWHQPGEFRYEDGTLYRRGNPVWRTLKAAYELAVAQAALENTQEAPEGCTCCPVHNKRHRKKESEK